MKRILKCGQVFKTGAFLILMCLLLVSFVSCPKSVENSIPTVKQVEIIIQGDGNLLIGEGVTFSVDEGTTWETVKKHSAIEGLVFDYGSRMQGWKIGDSSGIDLTNDYVFNESTIIFPVTTSLYQSVKYTKLDSYIAKLNPSDEYEVNYIEITDIKSSMLKGSKSPANASPLGEILKKHPEKKLILRLPATVSGLTDMSYCFFGCENIVGFSRIPDGVTNMEGCFIYCKNLEKAPVMPESVIDISGCFAGCEMLIEVPMIAPNAKDMEGCFFKCFTLEKVPAIPNSVTNMNSCFRDCSNLKEIVAISENTENMESCFFECMGLETVPPIPSSVTNMAECFKLCSNLKGVTLNCKYVRKKFVDAFSECTALEEGGIKVKPEHLYRFQDNAHVMGTRANRFAEQ